MTTEQTADRIVTDLKQGMVDAEHVLKASAGQAGEVLDDVRRRLLGALDAARAACGHLEELTGATAASTDRTIRANPYSAMGMAFAVGMLLGVVVVNRK